MWKFAGGFVVGTVFTFLGIVVFVQHIFSGTQWP